MASPQSGSEEARAHSAAKKTCPRCGEVFDAKAVFCPNDGARLESPDGGDDAYIGKVIGGDIEIREVAGTGAMGKVYRAHQRGIDRDVAVKILHRELSGNRPLVQRFHREAKIASRLQHAHVVEVYLAGQLPDGALYIVMEYLAGQSLAAALATAGGKLSLERALSIVLQICDAVGAGHARGIVHRDLKPENVMLVQRGDVADWVKVLDFGIARVSLGEQSMETAAGLIFGTARYISPEGAQGTTVGPPADVYAIATMMFQMLTGRTPFDADQPVGLLIKQIHEEPPNVASFAALPAPLAQVIMQNLAKDPTKRAENARVLGATLAAAAREADVPFSDLGAFARPSSDVLPISRAARSRVVLEPTLDDASGLLAVAPAPASPVVEPTAKPRRPILAIVLAFLLGATLAVLVAQRIENRRDAEHDTYMLHVRRALSAGRYTTPPGDNVRELVDKGLVRWPDDVQLLQVRSDAAHELVTRAMAARSVGDLGQARDLARAAIAFDESDHAAAILLGRYEDEFRLAGDGGLATTRVLLDVPAHAHVGQRAELTASVLVRGVVPATVREPKFLVTGPGLAPDGVVAPGAGHGGGTFAAVIVPPREGAYTIVFEATTEGIPYRAERALDVEP